MSGLQLPRDREMGHWSFQKNSGATMKYPDKKGLRPRTVQQLLQIDICRKEQFEYGTKIQM